VNKKEVLTWVKSIVFACVIAFICRHFLFTPTKVLGESMEPTFENNNRILISKITEIEPFDMIVFHAPDADDNYIKRVIGLPGDSLEVQNDVLYINGKKVSEPYLNENKKKNPYGITGDFTLKDITGHSRVPKGFIFVMGDNRLKSHDSREFGLIPNNSVLGEVKFRFFPFQEIGNPQ
jgi:signal peptidase I